MRLFLALSASVLACPAAFAQSMPGMAMPTDRHSPDHPAADHGDAPPQNHASSPAMDMHDAGDGHDPAMHHARHGTGQLGPYPATRDASGTAWQPDSASHDGLHLRTGSWSLMTHGQATLVHDDQGGPRGGTKTFVLSHLTVAASRPLGGGTLTLRALASLDPAMGANGYPLLLQTGETADGVRRLIDRQHPHDLIGELAAVYAHPVGAGVSAFLYGGPAGEPALGPPVYLHRAVGVADPETPIDHHWLDSTHLSFGVLTGGVVRGGWKLEASEFRGREPDQHRWNLETPAIDSWSVRLSWNPAPDWSLQVSRGRLHSVEQLEPDVDQNRTTASVIYNRPLAKGYWQTVAAWGRLEQLPPAAATRTSDAFLLESILTHGREAVFGRYENVGKDELFAPGSPRTGQLYTVAKLSLGYQHSIPLRPHVALDLGGLVSRYGLPRAIESDYGTDPTSFMLFTRLKLTG